MDFHEIRYFLAVTRTRNFTHAAVCCNVSQPALTRAIQKIEDRLGGPVFHRERGNTHLTELGRTIAPHFAAIAAAAEAATAAAAHARRVGRTEVRMDVASTIGPAPLVAFANDVRCRHPDIVLTVTDRPPGSVDERLKVGDADIAIMAEPNPPMPPLRSLALYDEQFFAVLPANHRLASAECVGLSDLADLRSLALRGCPFPGPNREEPCDRTPPLLERADWLQAQVAAGLGVGWLPEGTPLLPGLSVLPLSDPPPSRSIHLVTIAGRRWSAQTARVIDCAKHHVWPQRADPNR